MTTKEWEELNITKVFTPHGAQFTTVYAEFPTLGEEDAIKSLCVHLREGENLTVGRHVPWQARKEGRGSTGRLWGKGGEEI